MTTKVKFKEEWRAYQIGDVADMKPERANELLASGKVELLEGPAPPAPTALANGQTPEFDADEQRNALNRTIQQQNQRIQQAESKCAQWKQRAEVAEARVKELEDIIDNNMVNEPGVEVAAGAQPPVAEASTAEPAPVAAPAEDTAEPSEEPAEPVDVSALFPELDLPDSIKQKMVDAGWKTVDDVYAYGNANKGLKTAPGIGKVTADAINEALEKKQAASN